MRAWRDDYLRDGLVIARGFLDESTLYAMQHDLEDVVDQFAQQLLPREERLKLRRLGFSHRYTGVYEANLRANGGARSDLPAYFRSQAHTSGVHKFLTHSRLHELVRCLLPRELQNTPALKLYPVYMARGKVPDRISKSAMTVDWHQDAMYTYYWYSALNTTIAQIDEYARSVVNTWVPITDTDLSLGPVQLVRRRPMTLTRADMLCEGDGCEAKIGGPRREYLRVSEIDEYVAAFPERVVTAEMRRGDVLFFDQYTYHRGLPNVSPNETRWSVDFRFQDARLPTLRGHPGYVLGSDAAAVAAAEDFNAPLIATDEDWQEAAPAKRASEKGADRFGEESGEATHRWAELHEDGDRLLGALQLERTRHRGVSADSQNQKAT